MRSGVAPLSRRRYRARTLVLAYHNVAEASSGGDASLHIPLARFLDHLDVIQALAEVVPISRALDEWHGGPPRVVLTFDDAYRGTVRHGLRELKRRGLPATVFVAPEYVPDGEFWWDLVARTHPVGLTNELRRRALGEWRGRDDLVRRAVGADSRPAAAPSSEQRCASLEELTAIAGDGFTLGSHTWSHPNLAQATDSELAAELQRPLAWLRERFAGAAIPWLTYPYGISSPRVEAAAQTAGYVGAFRVDGGWLPKHPRNVFALPRFNVPAGLSPDGLALRLSGLLAR